MASVQHGSFDCRLHLLSRQFLAQQCHQPIPAQPPARMAIDALEHLSSGRQPHLPAIDKLKVGVYAALFCEMVRQQLFAAIAAMACVI